MANLSDPKSNDQSRPAGVPSFGDASKSEAVSNRAEPGVGGAPDDFSTPEAKRAGYGYSYVAGGVGSPMGGHNIDARNQYTSKLPRGSSL
jgi:hypothetical protein